MTVPNFNVQTPGRRRPLFQHCTKLPPCLSSPLRSRKWYHSGCCASLNRNAASACDREQPSEHGRDCDQYTYYRYLSDYVVFRLARNFRHGDLSELVGQEMTEEETAAVAALPPG